MSRPPVAQERTLRSSLVTSLEKEELHKIDKSLVTALKDNVDPSDDHMFNFERRLMAMSLEPLSFGLYNEKKVNVTDKEGQVFQVEKYQIDVFKGCHSTGSNGFAENGSIMENVEIKEETQNEKAKNEAKNEAQKILKEKKNIEITDLTKSSTLDTVMTKKGPKIVKSHRLSLRKRVRSRAAIRSAPLSQQADDPRDPLNESVYDRYHRSKHRIEKGIAAADKTKYLEDVVWLNESFYKLVKAMDSSSRVENESSFCELFGAMGNFVSGDGACLIKAVDPASGSFITAYINSYILGLRKGCTPRYHELLDLLDDFFVKNNGNSERVNGITEKTQYNSLRYLLQKSPEYREEFRGYLLSDKGYKEQYEFGVMRQNSSLNFQPKELEGNGRDGFSSFESFKKVLVGGRRRHRSSGDSSSGNTLNGVVTTVGAGVSVASAVDLSKQIYTLQLTTKDVTLLKLIKESTFIHPQVLETLDDIKTCGSGSNGEFLKINIANFKRFHHALHYISTLVLLTLYESLKLLRFFKRYWDNKNEYLLCLRLEERSRIANIKNSVIKNNKDRKNSKTKSVKSDVYDDLAFCVSDVSDSEYSDPDNDVTVDQLRRKRRKAQEAKYIKDYQLKYNDGAIPATTRIVINTGKTSKVIFDPRFGARSFESCDEL